jgi:hypothetical protein
MMIVVPNGLHYLTRYMSTLTRIVLKVMMVNLLLAVAVYHASSFGRYTHTIFTYHIMGICILWSKIMNSVRDAQGKLNGIQIARLKSKLGTRQVPTAELELVGARALLVSPPGRGVATISQLINITRLYNATTAVSGMRRIIALNRDFAHRRKVASRHTMTPLTPFRLKSCA